MKRRSSKNILMKKWNLKKKVKKSLKIKKNILSEREQKKVNLLKGMALSSFVQYVIVVLIKASSELQIIKKIIFVIQNFIIQLHSFSKKFVFEKLATKSFKNEIPCQEFKIKW